jgi:hypothetical protein
MCRRSIAWSYISLTSSRLFFSRHLGTTPFFELFSTLVLFWAPSQDRQRASGIREPATPSRARCVAFPLFSGRQKPLRIGREVAPLISPPLLFLLPITRVTSAVVRPHCSSHTYLILAFSPSTRGRNLGSPYRPASDERMIHISDLRTQKNPCKHAPCMMQLPVGVSDSPRTSKMLLNLWHPVVET